MTRCPPRENQIAYGRAKDGYYYIIIWPKKNLKLLLLPRSSIVMQIISQSCYAFKCPSWLQCWLWPVKQLWEQLWDGSNPTHHSIWIYDVNLREGLLLNDNKSKIVNYLHLLRLNLNYFFTQFSFFSIKQYFFVSIFKLNYLKISLGLFFVVL